MSIELEIVSPNKVIAKETGVTEVLLPGSLGRLGILPDHTEFMASLGTGPLSYKKGGSEQTFNISGGFFSIQNNKATILVETLLATVTDIDNARRDKTEKSR